MNIIQIGTCVGNDDLTEILNGVNPDLLVLVEPMKIHNDKIIGCYGHLTNFHLENIAIVADENSKEISFFYHKNDGPKYEVATTDVNHILKHGYKSDGIVELKVPCLTLNNLFKKYELKKIDTLFIDAEGLDDSLLKSIDFNYFEIPEIVFENLHIKDPSIYEYLTNLGYEITRRMGFMGWSSRAKKIQ